MLYPSCHIGQSEIEGFGVFSDQSISRGEVVGCLAAGCRFISENQYRTMQLRGDAAVVKTGIRFAGDMYIYHNSFGSESEHGLWSDDYLNHSRHPNLLYHSGMVFALKDIQPGEELTVDYKYFLSYNDPALFFDKETGKPIATLTATQALLESTRCLADLLESSAGTGYRSASGVEDTINAVSTADPARPGNVDRGTSPITL